MSAIPSAFEAASQRYRAGAEPFQQTASGSTYGFNNTLIRAATQNQDRKAVTLVDYDLHRTISVIGRRTLLSLARTMFWRVPALQASIWEQANLACSPFTPRYAGKQKAWGEDAASWLNDWHKIFDLGGWPYDYDSYVELLIVAMIVDGELFTLLTEDASGNPRIQIIPSHRVGSRYQTGGSAVVQYEGSSLFIDGLLIDDNLPYTFAKPIEWTAPMIDGVIVDGMAKPIAYRVYDDPIVAATYRDISARDIFPSFIPQFPGQLRGISLLASSVFDWQDSYESKDFEKLAQKIFNSRTIVEHNETGDIDPVKQLLSPAGFTTAPVLDASGNAVPNTNAITKTSADIVQLDGGAYTLFKAKENCKLEAFDWTRPNSDVQAFQAMVVRDAFRGTEWDSFFSLDPAHVGGAPMRIIVDKICRVLKKRRRLVAKSTLRVDTYGMAKGGMRSGGLSVDPDWYRWTYQGPPDPTADRRYDAQTDEMEYTLGWSTKKKICEHRNEEWREVDSQREIEADSKLASAQRLADKYKISIQEALMQLGMAGQLTHTFQEKEQEGPEEQESAQPVKTP